MMIRMIVVALCAGFIGSALAAEEGQTPEQSAQAPEQGAPVPVPVTPPGLALPEAASAPAAAQPPAPAAATPPAPVQPASAPAAAPQAAEEGSKSAIPPEKRQGPDITKCLSDGVKTDKEIAACAEPYSPRRRKHK